MDVKAEVLIEHICNRNGRWVFPGEVIDISRGEFQKRSKHPRNALVRRFVGPQEIQVVGPTENQALELPETKEDPVGEVEVVDLLSTLSGSRLQQMRKAELKALAEENGILVEEDTKQEIINKLLEENTDADDGEDLSAGSD